ncbi:Uncharacterized protein DAT39_021396, partial [Clarias magur]
FIDIPFPEIRRNPSLCHLLTCGKERQDRGRVEREMTEERKTSGEKGGEERTKNGERDEERRRMNGE